MDVADVAERPHQRTVPNERAPKMTSERIGMDAEYRAEDALQVMIETKQRLAAEISFGWVSAAGQLRSGRIV